MRKHTLYMLLPAVAATCLLTAPVGAAQRKQGQKPEAGVETSVSVGSTMLERYNMIVIPGVNLLDNVDVDLGIQGHIRVTAGTSMTVSSSGKKVRACTVAEDTFSNGLGQASAACMTDKDGDGRFDTAESAALLFTTKKLNPPVPYELIEVPENVGANNFRRMLVYLGVAQGTLRLSYREFANDMARPAFTEELSFPIAAAYPQTVTWRDTKITLLGLDNDGLRYRVEGSK